MRFSRCALIVCAATLLAACGGSQPPIGAPGAMPQSQRPHASKSGDTLIYSFFNIVGEPGVILDYPSGKLVGRVQTTGGGAIGSCSDSNGDVFEAGYNYAASGTIAEYTYGATQPTAIVTFSSGETAWACSVDQTTGNVAAIVRNSSGLGYLVAVLPRFQPPATIYSYAAMQRFLSIGYDAAGNLFLLGTLVSGGSYALAELPNGGSSFVPISLNLGGKIAQVTTVQWDGKYVTIEAIKNPGQGKPKDFPHAIYRLSISGSNARVVDEVKLDGLRGTEEDGSSWIQVNRNIVIFSRANVKVWKYPAGGKELAKLHSGVALPTYTSTVAAPASR
jgi:hypothetical protein